jgi:hypothetical protein
LTGRSITLEGPSPASHTERVVLLVGTEGLVERIRRLVGKTRMPWTVNWRVFGPIHVPVPRPDEPAIKTAPGRAAGREPPLGLEDRASQLVIALDQEAARPKILTSLAVSTLAPVWRT